MAPTLDRDDPAVPKSLKGIHMPNGDPWGGRSAHPSDGASRPKPKAKPATDPRPFSTSTSQRADPVPQSDPRPMPTAFAALRRDAALEEPVEVASDSTPDPIEDF